MNLLSLLLLSPCALLLPGFALLLLCRLPLARAGCRTELVDVALTALILSIAFNSWLALTLAELGLLRLPIFVAVWAALGAAGGIAAARGRALPFGTVVVGRWSAMMGLVLLLGAALAHRPAEYVFGIYDPGVYVNTALAMARTGALLVPDPELPRLTAEERRALFGNVPAPWHRSGMPFVTVHDAERGLLEPEWFHLFPAWMAIWALGGNPLWGAPTLYLGALGALYLIGRLLVHPAVGVGGALFLGLNVGEIWFGRYPMADLMAQTMALTGFALLAFAATRHSPLFAALAGASFGLVHLAKIDLVVLPAALAAALGWQWVRGRWSRCETALLVAYLLVVAQAAAHALLFARFYLLRIALDLAAVAGVRSALDLRALDTANLDRPFALEQLGRLAAANWWVFVGPAGVLLLVLALMLLLRGRAPWLRLPESPRLNLALAGSVAALSFWAFFIRPIVVDTDLPADPAVRAVVLANRESFVQLGWYFTPLGLAAAVAGVTAIGIARPHPVLLLFAGAGAISALILLTQSLVTPTHFWAFRRYLPLVVPVFSLGIAYLLFALAHSARSRRDRLLSIALGGVLALMLLWQARPILGETEYGGARRQLDALAEAIPADAVVLLAWSPAAERLAMPLHFAYGRTVFAIEEKAFHDPGLTAAVRRWHAEGRPVLYLRERSLPPAPTVREPIATVAFDVPALERPLDRLPRQWERLRFTVDLYRLDAP
ncbi:MAG: hypothetical protein RMM58_08415 [Chloroflexota bacterium]|nr:hypothetical protein [Dehalococcoidia bacterium]MDW8253887.1 hypothetical protein [Chloroflexota bacterium]